MYNIKEIHNEEIEKFVENLEKNDKKFVEFHRKRILKKFDSLLRDLRLNKTQIKKLDLLMQKLKEEWGIYIKHKKRKNTYLVYVFGRIYTSDIGIEKDKEDMIDYFNNLHVHKYDPKEIIEMKRYMEHNEENLNEMIKKLESKSEDFYYANEMFEEFTPLLNSISVPEIRKLNEENILKHFDTNNFFLEIGE